MRQQLAKITIPGGVEFADLRLSREMDGSISFDWSVIEKICEASGMTAETFRDAPEDSVATLLITWYQAHRKQGGEADPVAEDLFGEVAAEDAAGQDASHRPGRA